MLAFFSAKSVMLYDFLLEELAWASSLGSLHFRNGFPLLCGLLLRYGPEPPAYTKLVGVRLSTGTY
jgi:hypothetical protein